MLSIHLSVHALSYSAINQSIHINLSAGPQNYSPNVLIMLVCRHLLTMRLPGKAAV